MTQPVPSEPNFSDARADLEAFLRLPVGSTEPVFERFRVLPGAIEWGEGMQHFLYVPGTRPDRVLLVAHADTVWDHLWDASCRPDLSSGVHFDATAGVYRSSNPECGLGADDRAGCAILWQLVGLGHSLLVTAGEEHGQLGARHLVEGHAALAAEIQATHGFVVSFDRRNGREYRTYDVGTPTFRAYVGDAFSGAYNHVPGLTGADVRVLCRTIPAAPPPPCGVNVSVGFKDEHSTQETLSLRAWFETLSRAWDWLSVGKVRRYLKNPEFETNECGA